MRERAQLDEAAGLLGKVWTGEGWAVEQLGGGERVSGAIERQPGTVW